MVYYRKYRPQNISDLDSEKLRETLYAVLSGKDVPHAFLFTGPKGLGKTSTARIVAKVVNCEHAKFSINDPKNDSPLPGENIKSKQTAKSSIALKPSPQGKEKKWIEPDNTCDQCISITNGTNIDVLEIDGASNRGIDEIRELRERVSLAPSSAKKKVYIIDEVHMLTTEAFNALLKTIEEPPSHVIFIFCTTEPHKVPATILSRCFHISFQLATDDEIVHSLQRIVLGENLEVDNEALHIVAQMAEGGFRDAAKILEELVVLSEGKKVTKEFVEQKYKVSSTSHFVLQIVDFLANKKIKEALDIIEKTSQQGIEVKYFLNQILNFLHGVLLHKLGVVLDSKYETLYTKFTLEDIQNLIQLLSDATQQSKFAVIPQLPLELAIVQYGFASSLPVDSLGAEGSNIFSRANNSRKPTIDSLLKKQQQMKVKAMIHGAPLHQDIEGQAKVANDDVSHQSDIHSRPDNLTALYENIIYKVKPYNHSVAGVLRSCKIKEVTDTTIVFETSYKFHKERLEEKKTCEIIEQTVKEVTGKILKVSVVLKK